MPEPKQSIAAAHPIHGRASASEAQLQKPRGPEHTTSTTQGTPHPRTTHADTYTCWRGRACKRMCVQSERTSACRSWHHLTKTCAWGPIGGYGVHKTGTYRLRRGGSCTGMTLSQLSSPPYELFGTVRFEQQYTQHVSEQGEREQYKHRNVGSDQGRPPPQTALRQLLTEGRDKASSRRWSNVASAACVRAKRAPLTYLNLLLGRHGRTLASEAWAPRARHQKRLQNPVLLAREWPSPQQRERCAGGVALSRVNGHRLGPSAVAWTGCSTGHQGRCRDTGEGTEGAPHAHPRHPLLLPWRWWCEGVAATVMP
jgi:hypothetical protein